MKQQKIINDPLYGFISLEGIFLDIVRHKYFIRLNRIKQLGLSNLVYPGANHTRFQHSIGCFHKMKMAIDTLKKKNIDINIEEEKAVLLVILLHDIGHGPFSHALENTIVKNIRHEELTLLFMKQLNIEFDNQLDLAIKIFIGDYHKKFLCQLVSSQLDIDRMDYLMRDSFFSGVSEGIIGIDRIINMMNVKDNELVVEEKGIYSVEKFIVARRLMYWQVYLHKTVLVAEHTLVNILKRAKYLYNNKTNIFLLPNLELFFEYDYCKADFENKDNILIENYASLDDYDIFSCIKQWQNSDDFVLSFLSKSLVNRKLMKISLTNELIPENQIKDLKLKATNKYKISEEELDYIVFTHSTSNNAYNQNIDKIKILFKNDKLVDLVQASDHFNIRSLSQNVIKNYIIYPKDI